MKKNISLKLTFSIFAVLFLTLQISAFHRFHTSFTKMDYNEDDKLIEMTVRLFTHDFETVFRKIAKNKKNPETLENIDELILKYLNENLVLTDQKGLQMKMNWVGKEFEVDTLYIYVEIPFEGEINNVNIKNSIFFESFAKQINYISVKYQKKKSDLVFKVGDKYKTLDFK